MPLSAFFKENFASILSHISDPNFLFYDLSWFSGSAASSHPSFPDSYSFTKFLNCSNFVFPALFQFQLHCFSYYINFSVTPFFRISLIFLTSSFLRHLLQIISVHPPSIPRHFPSFFRHFHRHFWPLCFCTSAIPSHDSLTTLTLLYLLVCWILGYHLAHPH